MHLLARGPTPVDAPCFQRCWCGVVGVIVMGWGDAVVVLVMSVVWCVVVLLV